MPKIVIVGGGIVGASFAYHANLAGFTEITILAEALPGDKSQATTNTWGWVNGYAANDKNYAAFRLANLKYWSQLIEYNNRLKKTSKGALFWDLSDTELKETIIQHQNWGHSIKEVNQSEIDELLPNLFIKPINAAYGINDIAVEGSKVTSEFIKASGCKVLNVYVKKIIYEENTVIGVETDQGIIYTDEVIIAAGLGTPNLLSTLKINFKMHSSLGLLAYTKPLPELLLKYPITGADFHARQDDKGRLVIGGKFDEDTSKEENIQEVAIKLVQEIATRLNYHSSITLDHYTLGIRPLPFDGRPKIGRLKNNQGENIKGVYIAVMHSGITNAPLAGKLGIKEILTGKRDLLLSDFLPQSVFDNGNDNNV